MENLTPRGELILLELGKSYKLKGSSRFMPPNEELIQQAILIDADLEKNIEIRLISALFDIARYKDDHPALTGLRKALKSSEFREKFGVVKKYEANYFKLIERSDAEIEKHHELRQKLANFDFRKKNDKAE